MKMTSSLGLRKIRAVGMCALGSGMLAVLTVRAQTTAFALDPVKSTVTLSGSVGALGLTIPLKEQGPGSLVPSYSGTLTVNRVGSTVEFVSGSQVVPVETGPWQPGVGGDAGQALASYAAKASANLGFFSVDATAASRRLVFDLLSAPVPLQNGEFGSGLIALKFLDTANSTLDFRVSGALSQQGSKVLSGLLTNTIGGTGKIVTVDGVETLTLPIDSTYGFDVDTAVGKVTFTLNFKGQLVATATAIPDPPVVSLNLPTVPGEPLKLFWSSSYKLQRATTLLPPDWADFATQSPVIIPTVQPGEFFQVVHK